MRLPKSLAARIGAVGAVAAIALTGAATAANASTAQQPAPAAAPAAHHRIPTHLGIANSAPVGHAHQTTAILRGRLTAAHHNLRHLRVWLERLGAKGRWHVVKVNRTHAHGRVYFRVHVGKKAGTFRLVFRGTRNFAPSVSRTDTISPVPAPVAAS
jgi:hypothetical protein